MSAAGSFRYGAGVVGSTAGGVDQVAAYTLLDTAFYPPTLPFSVRATKRTLLRKS